MSIRKREAFNTITNHLNKTHIPLVSRKYHLIQWGPLEIHSFKSQPHMNVSIKSGMCFLDRETNITSNVCFPGRGTLRICFPGYEKHISLGICVSLTGKHTTSDMCFMGRGTYITRDTCFLGRKTHITRDMCFSRREQISPGIWVSQLNMCFSSGTYH